MSPRSGPLGGDGSASPKSCGKHCPAGEAHSRRNVNGNERGSLGQDVWCPRWQSWRDDSRNGSRFEGCGRFPVGQQVRETWWVLSGEVTSVEV